MEESSQRPNQEREEPTRSRPRKRKAPPIKRRPLREIYIFCTKKKGEGGRSSSSRPVVRKEGTKNLMLSKKKEATTTENRTESDAYSKEKGYSLLNEGGGHPQREENGPKKSFPFLQKKKSNRRCFRGIMIWEGEDSSDD